MSTDYFQYFCNIFQRDYAYHHVSILYFYMTLIKDFNIIVITSISFNKSARTSLSLSPDRTNFILPDSWKCLPSGRYYNLDIFVSIFVFFARECVVKITVVKHPVHLAEMTPDTISFK